MPLHEPPIQRCGSSHWLSDPCPKGECDLLVFEQDQVKLIGVAQRTERRVSTPQVEGSNPSPGSRELAIEPEPEVTPDGPVKAMTAAEKQKLWRQRNAEKVKERDRLRKAAKRNVSRET